MTEKRDDFQGGIRPYDQQRIRQHGCLHQISAWKGLDTSNIGGEKCVLDREQGKYAWHWSCLDCALVSLRLAVVHAALLDESLFRSLIQVADEFISP